MLTSSAFAAATISIRGTEVTENINYFGRKDVETTR
jgi:hypothetical protein